MSSGARDKQSEAERRQLTVLFCDLVGSTQLSQKLDAEDLRELVLAYQKAAAEVIYRYEGHIAQYLGDGLLVYFGHPAAHEDDAERAVRAGYDILAALKRLNTGSPSPSEGEGRGEGANSRADILLSARIGIHTGSVVVGQMGAGGRHETLAMGDTTNIAARVQGVAEPDTVVISQATLKLVPGLFITKDLGAQQLKGVAKPVNVFQIIQPSGVRTRLEAAEHLTPFVGRTQELALLTDRWQQASEGQGQAVLLTAEPGLGKSRLTLTLRERMTDSAYSWLECRCSPLTRNSAYQPIIELMHRGLVIKESDTQEIKLQRLEQGLDAIGADKQEAVPLLAPLLNLQLPERYQSSQFGPELKRKRTMELLIAWTLALAKLQPLALVYEDLHWADPSTLELLTRMLEQIPSHNILVLMTARLEFQPNWPVRPYLAILTLQPLRPKETGQMLDSLTGHRALPQRVQEKLLQRADGVPLFLEEITKTLIESGQLTEHDDQLILTGRIEDLAIPATLQDSLMARLDRLGEAKETIQLCAVIGREIPYKLLQAVAGEDEPTLQARLQKLTNAQLLYPRGSPPEASYLFKHALIQDIAYESLLKSARQKLHGVIAQALETNFPERAANEPEVLAAHFEKTGLMEAAVRYYKNAAEKAIAAISLEEAIVHAEHALRLLALLPENSARNHFELDLCLTLGNCRTTTLGYGHGDVERVFERARELCGKTEDPTLLGRAFANIFLLDYNRADFAKALELGKKLAALGRSIRSEWMQFVGISLAGWTLMSLGQVTEAMDYSQQALSLVTPEIAATNLRMMGYEAHAGVAIPIAYIQWLQGYPDRALETTRWILDKATQSNHPHGLAWVLCQAMTGVLLFRREPQQVMEPGRVAVELSERYGFIEWLAYAQQHLGLAHCMLGHFDEGLPLLHTANAAKRSRNTLAFYSVHAVLEAEQCRLFGRNDEAQAVLDSAFVFMEQSNERFWEAELHRVKGELVLAENRPSPNTPPPQPSPASEGGKEKEAENCFQKALDVSRSQQAKSLELRAATSLARLWQKRNRIKEARELLQPVYDWFTEGFDTPDLKDTKALLDKLASQ